MRTKQFFLYFTLFFLVSFATKAQTLSEEQKITALITYVSKLGDAKFIRNGDVHDAKKAAEHLRMKRDKAGKSITTALQFIDKVATKSSISGDYYMIKYANGTSKKNCDVLKEELKRIEAKK
jgi:hypothetical protein